MKKENTEYLTYFSSEFLYIPYDEVDNLNVSVNKKIYNNMIVGKNNDNSLIFSPVSGLVSGMKKSLYLDGEKKSLIIENDFIDKKEKLNPFKNISKIKKSEVNELLHKYNLYHKIDSKTTLVIVSKYDKKKDLGDMVINHECYEEILEAIDELLTLFNIKYSYISIPKNDYESISSFEKYINAFPNIAIVDSNKKFKEKNTIYYTIEEILAVNKAIHLDYLLDNTMITIKHTELQILRVKLYTSLIELLKALKINYKNKIVIINDKVFENINDFIISREVRTIEIK